jgi:hypothetical protein
MHTQIDPAEADQDDHHPGQPTQSRVMSSRRAARPTKPAMLSSVTAERKAWPLGKLAVKVRRRMLDDIGTRASDQRS